MGSVVMLGGRSSLGNTDPALDGNAKRRLARAANWRRKRKGARAMLDRREKRRKIVHGAQSAGLLPRENRRAGGSVGD
jgi:hypothetical protein